MPCRIAGDSDPTREDLIDRFFEVLGGSEMDVSHMTGVFRGPIPHHRTGEPRISNNRPSGFKYLRFSKQLRHFY